MLRHTSSAAADLSPVDATLYHGYADPACAQVLVTRPCRPLSHVPRPAAFLSRLNHQHDTPWPQYRPCGCAGAAAVCGPACACAKSKNFCEKWCACGPACANRHPGCTCDASCGVLCPCFEAGRECDPHKCHGCTATALGLVRDGDRVCLNLNITLGVARTLAVGLSAVAGWGCFVMEAVPKNGFLVRRSAS